MALDVYFREEIANILTGYLMARPDWGECLEAVGASIGVRLMAQEYLGMKVARRESEKPVLWTGR